MQNSTELIERIRSLCMVRRAEQIPRGHIRVETGFLYPDGSSVDVFAVDDEPLLPATRLSDLGQTLDLLLHHDVKPWSTKKRSLQLADSLRLYGVEQDGGELVKRFDDGTLQEAILLLGQACVRTSDLLFTKRLQLQSVFSDDVEEFLSDADLRYEPNVSLQGKYGSVPIDFLVHGSVTTSAVVTLSSRVPGASHTQATEVFRKFHDLASADRPEQRIALLDDSANVALIYRSDDLDRIRTYATIQPFSDRTQTLQMLAA